MDTLLDVYRRVRSEVTALPNVSIPLSESVDRILTHDVLTSTDHPAFDQSAMDGYVLHQSDLNYIGLLKLAAESIAAGDSTSRASTPGTAIRILTGAPIPEDGATVRIQETVEVRSGHQIELTSPTEGGKHIRYRGSDIAAGTCIATKGSVVTDAMLVAFANLNVQSVTVPRLPQVAFTTSGDELIDHGQRCPTHGEVVDGNRVFLRHALDSVLCSTTELPRIKDSRDAVELAVQSFQSFDLVVTCGGMSVGDFDILGEVLRTRAEVLVYKIAVKPGKPVLIARLGKTWVVGLPGNPVSTFVAYHLFVVPLLKRLGGYTDAFPEFYGIPLATPSHAGGGRLEFMRGRVSGDALPTHVHLMPKQGSAALSGILPCNALVGRPARAMALKRESLVGVHRLGARATHISLDQFESRCWQTWLS